MVLTFSHILMNCCCVASRKKIQNFTVSTWNLKPCSKSFDRIGYELWGYKKVLITLAADCHTHLNFLFYCNQYSPLITPMKPWKKNWSATLTIFVCEKFDKAILKLSWLTKLWQILGTIYTLYSLHRKALKTIRVAEIIDTCGVLKEDDMKIRTTLSWAWSFS